jgi:hypothetical protein
MTIRAAEEFSRSDTSDTRPAPSPDGDRLTGPAMAGIGERRPPALVPDTLRLPQPHRARF